MAAEGERDEAAIDGAGAPVGGGLGVILAGGLARRMGGGDKGLLALGGRSLIDRVAARLAPQLVGGRAALRLNANGDPARFLALGLPVVADSAPDFPGPLAGVLAGLDAGRAAGAHWIVTAAADTPFPPRDLLARLAASRNAAGAPIALAATRDAEGKLRPHPTFGLWPVRLAEDLRAAVAVDGVRKVLAWTDRHGAALTEFPVTGGVDPFFNVNTPEDLAEAARIAERIDAGEESAA